MLRAGPCLFHLVCTFLRITNAQRRALRQQMKRKRCAIPPLPRPEQERLFVSFAMCELRGRGTAFE